MSEPPMPSILGMLSSMGPAVAGPGFAPRSSARRYAFAASFTRNAMAHADGPCVRANACPNESGSALMMKLMSPWACSVTFFERCRATAGKPSRSNKVRSSSASGAVYSTNSNPSVPIGLSGTLTAAGVLMHGPSAQTRGISYTCNHHNSLYAANSSMPSSRPSLELDRFLPYRLSVLTNTLSTAIAGAYQRRFGLTIPEWRVMAVLAMNPGLSAAEVAQRTAMDKVAVSRAVASLLKHKRIGRKMARADRRRSLLQLAPAGQRVYAQVIPFALEYERELIAPLSKRERETIDRAIRVL